ncbi:thermitase [Tumebacillus sp. BK434]|uniref:S8 family serine peptidase n=1 Tax=Tumebacillus sp. BK434 TaxID=2512169 RepID=UPI00104D2E57|nr:S8 family serine peptidase [Tumebacillus sp. BK434]TCP58230.1 thermitase [Tumebacillus sp. BK434]
MKKQWYGALGATLALGLALSAAAPVQAASVTYVEQGKDSILVKVKHGKNADQIAAKAGVQKGKRLGKSDWHVFQVPAGKLSFWLDKLKQNGDVELVEADQEVSILTTTPNDPNFSSQWYLNKIQAPQAWDFTQGSSMRKIAILDTGVDVDHPDLIGKVLTGYDFVNGDTNADDDQGHGTAVAGVAAAYGNNSIGTAGVDWNAKILPVKVLNASGSGTTSNIINGIYYAADQGANVINLSLAGGSYSSAMQAAINYAYNAGAIIVAAADDYANPSYPAGYANVVGVTATSSTDVPSINASYIDIGAPGINITTTKMGGGIATYSGASYSAAIVSGVMTLGWSCNLSYSNTTVQNRVLTQVDPIAGAAFGRVNAFKTVYGF